jgi:nitrogen regulatory protein P-II 1
MTGEQPAKMPVRKYVRVPLNKKEEIFMKEIAIIIRPEKLEIVKEILNNRQCGGMTISSVMGCGTQRGSTEPAINTIKGFKTTINLLPKIRVEVVVKDEIVDDLIADIREKVVTGNVGDGKIFIRPMEDAVRIRTGERGDKAL